MQARGKSGMSNMQYQNELSSESGLVVVFKLNKLHVFWGWGWWGLSRGEALPTRSTGFNFHLNQGWQWFQSKQILKKLGWWWWVWREEALPTRSTGMKSTASNAGQPTGWLTLIFISAICRLCFMVVRSLLLLWTRSCSLVLLVSHTSASLLACNDVIHNGSQRRRTTALQ